MCKSLEPKDYRPTEFDFILDCQKYNDTFNIS